MARSFLSGGKGADVSILCLGHTNLTIFFYYFENQNTKGKYKLYVIERRLFFPEEKLVTRNRLNQIVNKLDLISDFHTKLRQNLRFFLRQRLMFISTVCSSLFIIRQVLPLT